MTPTAIPWYQSHTIRALLVAVLSQVLVLFKPTQNLAPQAQPLVDSLLEIITICAAGWAGHARVTKPLPDIVATQAAATAINQKPPETP